MNHQRQPSPMLPLEYRNLPVKFLGQRPWIVRADESSAHSAEEDGGQTVCKDTIRFLANLRSAKEHRYNKEKHVLLDIVPEDGEIVVRSKKKHREVQLRITLPKIVGVGIVGRKFALRERSGLGRCDTIYAFETQRKGDDSGLLVNLFGSITTIHGATPNNVGSVNKTAGELSTEMHGEDRVEYEIHLHRTLALEAERARLEAELRAMTLEREVETLKRERAETQAEMTMVASDVARDMAALREDLAHNSTLFSEVEQLKRGVAILATRHLLATTDEGHAATPPTEEEQERLIAEFWNDVVAAGDCTDGSQGPGAEAPVEKSWSLVLRLTERLTQFKPARASRFERQSTSTSATSADSGNARSAFSTRHGTDLTEASIEDREGHPAQQEPSPQLLAIKSARSATHLHSAGVEEPPAQSQSPDTTDTFHGEQAPSPIEVDLIDRHDCLVMPTVQDELHSPQPPTKHEVIEDIVITRNGQPLGIHIAGGTDGALHDLDTAVYITIVQDVGAAYASGCIHEGDKILVANGVDLEDVTHQQAVEAIRGSNDTVTLTVSRIVGGNPADITTLSALSEQTTIVEDVLEIDYDHTADGLGFLIKGGLDSRVSEADSSIYVTQIIESGTAHKDGRLRVGDRLIEVNGVSTVSITHSEAVGALTISTGQRVHMVVSRLPLQQEEVLTIDFPITEEGLGFSVLGGVDQASAQQYSEADSGILVSRILDGSSAAVDGRLQRGDRLLEVNGHSFVDQTHHSAVEILSSLKDHATLKIARVLEDREDHDVFIEVILQLPDSKGSKQDLGFSIGGGSGTPMIEGDSSIYISQVVEGEFAHRDGQLRFGDKVLSINEVDVTDVPHSTAIRAIKDAKRELRMQLARLPLENEEMDDVLQVHLSCVVGEKLGMQICGGTDDPDGQDQSIYIDSISPAGAAATDGRLRAGDKLLICNGQSLAGVTRQAARELLLTHLANLKLTLSRRCI